MNLIPGRDTADPALTKPKVSKPPTPKPVGAVAPSRTYTPASTGGTTVTQSPGSVASSVSSDTVKPSAPVTKPGDSTKAASDSTADMLAAVLRSIEAEYGLSAEQLMADESEIGRTYRLLVAEQQRKGLMAREALQGQMLDRGIVQSGIYVDEVGRQEAAQSEAVAALQAEEQARLARIAATQASLPAQEAAARAAAAQQAAAAGLDLDVIKALAQT